MVLNRTLVAIALTAAAGLPCDLAAQEAASLGAVLARAREVAPAVLLARARAEEARGRLSGASARFQDGPEVSATAGPRWYVDDTRAEYSVGASRFLETGGQRAARMAAAQAALEAADAEVARVVRDTLREAAALYLEGISTLDRIDVLTTAHVTASEVEHAASRRFALGDVAVLDVNVARATRARAGADLSVARAEHARLVGDLAALLNWPGLEKLTVDRRTPALRDIDESLSTASLATRPDLAALTALERSAEAERRLAVGSGRPDVGLSLEVNREDGSPALIGGLVLRLPSARRQRGDVQAAAARVTQARLQRDGAHAAAGMTLSAAVRAYRQQKEALAVLEADALAAADENERLARRSYEAGQISLADWLLYRRELLDTQLQHLAVRLACVLALVEIDAMTGVLQ
jgi:cobalt-zinc-cadmium efflux system outer membrane protein